MHVRRWLWVAPWLITVQACSKSASTTGSPVGAAGVIGAAGLPAVGMAGASGTTATAHPSAGSAGNAVGSSAAGASGAPLAAAGANATAMGAVQGDLPCDVAAFLNQHCIQCHGHMTRMGAPMSLVDAASFQAQRNGQTVAALVHTRVTSPDRPMPPTGMLPMTETAALLQWVDGGAQPAANGCGVMDMTSGAAGSGAAGTTPPPPPPVDGGVLEGGGDWTMFGGDLANTRNAVGETSITPQTVSRLKPLWTFKGASNTATPAVVGGVVYVPTWDGKVNALDARTGMMMWATTLPHLIDSSPAVTATQVFVSDDHGALHALDRDKGTVQWSQQVDPHPEAHLWSSPIYIDDAKLVVVGVASGEEQTTPPYDFKGSVVGYDAATGMEKWRFYTTTADAQSGPGVAVWSTAAVDTTRKLVFIGTGNSYSGTAGQYVDSILAINYQTGKLTWYKQFTAGDVFSIYGGGGGPDFDLGASANLFKVGDTDVVGCAIKSGDYAVLDRDAGKPVWMAHVGGGSSMGGMIASAAYGGDQIIVASNSFPAPENTTIAGLDSQKGTVLWMQSIPNALTYGGVLYVNGIAFVGTTDANIYAFDAKSGNMLWKAAAPDSIAGGPSVAHGMLLVPWGYTWTLRMGDAGTGGLTAYSVQ